VFQSLILFLNNFLKRNSNHKTSIDNISRQWKNFWNEKSRITQHFFVNQKITILTILCMSCFINKTIWLVNICLSISIHSIHLNENYENIELVLNKINYVSHIWKICGDFKVLCMLLGQQSDFTKFHVSYVNRTVWLWINTGHGKRGHQELIGSQDKWILCGLT